MEVLSHLQCGTNKQNEAYKVLLKSQVFELLKEFQPFLAGTIPLDVYVDSSDLDIICQSRDLNDFLLKAGEHFAGYSGFKCFTTSIRGVESAVIQFDYCDFAFELFCQDVPVTEQMAVVHFEVEKKLLDLGGENAKDGIRELKKAGMATEPAFAHYFGIEGDPYIELAKLRSVTVKELSSYLKK